MERELANRLMYLHGEALLNRAVGMGYTVVSSDTLYEAYLAEFGHCSNFLDVAKNALAIRHWVICAWRDRETLRPQYQLSNHIENC